MIRKVCIVLLSFLLVIAPVVVSQEASTEALQESASPPQASTPPPQAPQNEINVVGETIVTTENGITVIPTVIDEQLHNEALLLRAIGTPLYDAGEVLLSISVATWIVWTIAFVPAAVIGESSFEVSGFDLNIGGVSSGLLDASIVLSATGLAFLIGGGITKSIGDDLRDRSFAELR